MNEFDDLDVLERELGPALRLVLHRVAAEIESDEAWQPRVAPDQLPMILLDDRHRDGASVSIDPTLVSLDTDPVSRRPGGRRHWFVVAAAAAVLAIVLALVVGDRDGSEPEVPAGPPNTPLVDEPMVTAFATAEAFSDAWVARDGASVEALFEPGGTVEIGQLPTYAIAISGPSMMPALHDWFSVVGYDFHAGGCQIVQAAFGVPSPHTEAFCSFTYESDLTRHFDQGPVSINMWLEMGAGDDFLLRYVSGGFFDVDADIGFVFQDWVSTHHPTDSGRMYESPDSTAPRVDPTSIELWDRYLDEFTASAATSSLLADQPRTMAEYGARVRSICATADARFEKERVDSQSDADVSEAAARIGSESLTELRALKPPEPSDQLDEVFSDMEREITLEARAAAAWYSGDTELANSLIAERVDLTHNRSGSFDFAYCPISLGA